MTIQMDETFTNALRDLLVEQVHDTHGRRWWSAQSRRWTTAAGAVLGLAAVGGGVSYAAGVWSTALPGGSAVRTLARSAIVTGTGTQTVKLGPRPAGVTAIDMALTCLTPGSFTFTDGASMTCNRTDFTRQPPATATYTMRLASGKDTTTITADPGARWRLIATYVAVRTTAWAINASGQTYGVQNQYGVPDLIAVIATNHHSGYVYATQLNPPAPQSLAQALRRNNAPPKALIVYNSDGKTPIGVFILGK